MRRVSAFTTAQTLILQRFAGDPMIRLGLGKVAGLCFVGAVMLAVAGGIQSQAAPVGNQPVGQSGTTPTPGTSAPAAQQSSPAAQQAAPATAQAQDEWPDGPGKDKFLQTCSACHSPENVLGHNLDADGWSDIMNKMVTYGAQGSEADFTQIYNYLVANFPPVPAKININTATAMNLRNWVNMPETQAEAIVAYRAQHGDFKSLDDVKAVPGADAKFLDSIKDFLTYDPAPQKTTGN